MNLIHDEIINDRDYFAVLDMDEGIRIYGPHLRYLIKGDSGNIIVDVVSDKEQDIKSLRQFYDEHYSKKQDNNESHKSL